ncbi:MAG: hypothetical protein WAV28_04795 [Sedimentisphaerales bacterium]
MSGRERQGQSGWVATEKTVGRFEGDKEELAAIETGPDGGGGGIKRLSHRDTSFIRS